MWPGSRAALGGLLAAIGVGALAWSITDARAEPSSEFVVAVVDLAPGTVITSDDVGLLAVNLPTSIASATFGAGTETEVLGTVVVNPVSAGELVVRSDVRDGVPDAGSIEVTFELDVPRALNGRLHRGEQVDVVATVGTGVSQMTSFVAQGASVIWVEEVGSGGLSSGTAAVTLALDSRAELAAVIAAIDTGDVTLARVPPGYDALTGSDNELRDTDSADPSETTGGPQS